MSLSSLGEDGSSCMMVLSPTDSTGEFSYQSFAEVCLPGGENVAMLQQILILSKNSINNRQAQNNTTLIN